MHTGSANRNGHRRRQLVARVLAEETHCILCGQLVNKELRYVIGAHGPKCKGQCSGCKPHPRSPVVDEDLPRSRGGSAISRSNCHLMHRECNAWKGARTLQEARQALAGPKGKQKRTTTNLISW